MKLNWVAHAMAKTITETTKSLKICYLFHINRIQFKIVRRWTEKTHQWPVSRSGSAVIERSLACGVNVYHLHSCWRSTFWAPAVVQMMWC